MDWLARRLLFFLVCSIHFAQCQISKGPVNMTVIEGSTVRLFCTALTAVPTAIGYTWIVQGSPSPSWLLPCSQQQSNTNGDRCIFNIQANQGGSYECHADDLSTGRRIGQQTGYLTVLRPIKFAVTPRDTTVATDTPARLSCSVDTSAGSPAQISWFRRSLGNSPVPVAVSSRVTIDYSTGTLMFSSVKLSDVDQYICNASNAATSAVATAVLRLDGTTAPTILSTAPTSLTIPESATFILPCKSFAVPAAVIDWYKETSLIYTRPHKANIFSNGSLRISNVEPLDAGTYKCIARNTLGKEESSPTVVAVGDSNPSPGPGGSSGGGTSSTTIGIAIGGSVGGVVVILLIVFLVYMKARATEKNSGVEWTGARSLNPSSGKPMFEATQSLDRRSASMFSRQSQKSALQRRLDGSFHGKVKSHGDDDVAILTQAMS